MKKLIVLLIICLSCIACNNHPDTKKIREVRMDCSEIDPNIKAKFILDCIKNGNPNSDEEPEDWIPLCEDMAEKTFCKEVTVIVYKQHTGGGWYTEYKYEIVGDTMIKIDTKGRD